MEKRQAIKNGLPGTPSDANRRSLMGRRELLRLLGIGGVGLMLGGCRPSKQADVTTLRFWGTGTLDVGEHWKRLTEDTGLRVQFTDNQNDPGPVIAAMSQGTAARDYDLNGLQGGAERELAEKGLILPWNTEEIPNWARVWDWAKNIRYTQYNGRLYGIPTVINADSMIYLPEKVGEVDSYAVIFDPKLKGKTAMEDAWINSVIFTAIFLKENSLQKIHDPGNLSPDELGAVMEFLIQHKRDGQFRTFWNGWEQGVQLIGGQEVWVMAGWEPIVYAAQKAGVNAKYAVPKEGYEGWSNDVLLHKGAEIRGVIEDAHRFVNWELGGYYGCALGELRGYVVSADTSVEFAEASPKLFNPERQKELVNHVREKFLSMKGQVYWQNVRPDEYKLYDEWWARLRAA